MVGTRFARLGILTVLLGVTAGCCGDRPRLFDRVRSRFTNADEVTVVSPGCDSCNQAQIMPIGNGYCEGCENGQVNGQIMSGPVISGPIINGPILQQGQPNPPVELLPTPNNLIPPAGVQERPAQPFPADPQSKLNQKNLNKTVTQSNWLN